MPTPEVLVFGEALADSFPEKMTPGGAPFNVARHLAQLGCKTHLMSRVANDNIGQAIVENANVFTVNLGLTQQQCSAPSGHVQVLVSDDGTHRFLIDTPSAWDFIEPAPPAWLLEHPVQAMVYGSLALRSMNSRLALTDLLKQVRSLNNYDRRKQRPLVICDFNWREGHTPLETAVEIALQADWLKLNDEEWYLLAQHLSLDESEPDALLDLYSLQKLIITRGADGYVCYGKSEKEEDLIVIEGNSVQLEGLVDTVGAGDSFLAFTLAAYLYGKPLPEALRLAAGFASSVCGIRGAVPEELSFYEDWKVKIV